MLLMERRIQKITQTHRYEIKEAANVRILKKKIQT